MSITTVAPRGDTRPKRNDSSQKAKPTLAAAADGVRLPRTLTEVLAELQHKLQAFSREHLDGACECHTLPAYYELERLTLEARRIVS